MEKPAILNITTLTNEWVDKDIILLHACFQLLTNFVEQENPFTGHVEWDNDEEHQHAKHEILKLYDWWTSRKILCTTEGTDIFEKSQYEEDNTMLIRLVKIRQFLWT